MTKRQHKSSLARWEESRMSYIINEKLPRDRANLKALVLLLQEYPDQARDLLGCASIGTPTVDEIRTMFTTQEKSAWTVLTHIREWLVHRAATAYDE